MNKFQNQTIAELPKKFWAIRDATVEHVLSNSPLPKDLNDLQEWLATDGWDYLLAAWIDDDVVLNLKNWANYQFLDSSLRATEGVDDSVEITDQMRIEYARSAISDAIEEYEGYDNPSVHSFLLQRDDGMVAVLGCTVEIHGQAGPIPVWHGVFSSKEVFYNYLRKSGFLFHKEANLISAPEIMALWQIEKKKTARRKKTSS